MKRRRLFLLFLSLLSVLLFACQATENNKGNFSVESEKGNDLSINNDFASLHFSKPSGQSRVNFDDEATFHAFQEVFLTAKKVEGIADMDSPEFYMDIVYEDNEESRLYLWIGEKGQESTLMKLEDTHTIYTVPAEETERLVNLVARAFN